MKLKWDDGCIRQQHTIIEMNRNTKIQFWYTKWNTLR